MGNQTTFNQGLISILTGNLIVHSQRSDYNFSVVTYKIKFYFPLGLIKANGGFHSSDPHQKQRAVNGSSTFLIRT